MKIGANRQGEMKFTHQTKFREDSQTEARGKTLKTERIFNQ